MWRKVLVYGAYTPPGSVSSLPIPIFSGYVRAWNEEFPDFASDAVVSVDCVDVFAKLAAFEGFEQTPAGAGELSGARIARILANTGIDDLNQAIDPGTVTMQATTLAGNALTELKLVADSEGGAIWAGPSFDINFDGQYALIEKYRSTSSDTLFVSTGDVPAYSRDISFDSVSTSYDGDLVINSAAFQAVGGAVQEAVSLESRAVYGNRQITRTDLICENDSQALSLARRTVALNQQAERRIESITFRPQGQLAEDNVDAAWTALSASITLRALSFVGLLGPSGNSLNLFCYIQGISHTITPDDWVVGIQFSSAEGYLGYFNSRWDLGLFDSASWAW